MLTLDHVVTCAQLHHMIHLVAVQQILGLHAKGAETAVTARISVEPGLLQSKAGSDLQPLYMYPETTTGQ